MYVHFCEKMTIILYILTLSYNTGSLVPRPSLTAFFAAVAKSVVTAAKKAVREGLGMRL